MPESRPTQPQDLLDQRYRVPDHVVRRAFAAETVVLNLHTGSYHGLNPVAGRMLELIEETGDPRAAVDGVLEEWAVDRARVERDAVALCGDLLERGLIETDVDRDTR
jgi:hypothetical protein